MRMVRGEPILRTDKCGALELLMHPGDPIMQGTGRGRIHSVGRGVPMKRGAGRHTTMAPGFIQYTDGPGGPDRQTSTGLLQWFTLLKAMATSHGVRSLQVKFGIRLLL